MSWRTIDSAPRDGTLVLLAGQYVDHPSVAAWDGKEWVGQVDGQSAVRYMSDFGTEYLTVDVPEFWQPLPEWPVRVIAVDAEQGEGASSIDGQGNSTEQSHNRSSLTGTGSL